MKMRVDETWNDQSFTGIEGCGGAICDARRNLGDETVVNCDRLCPFVFDEGCVLDFEIYHLRSIHLGGILKVVGAIAL